MSLQDLLPLDDSDVEMVATLVEQWCRDHCVLLESDRGRVAMTTAVGLVLSGEQSPPALIEALSRHMRIEQYKHPLE
ncbi:hypothetical protein J2W42_005179 [Rhizobium tibeticum]|uniref:hypothetical protein n=1 Tax=Rhizobium tibeticum TaxID=501024 RepID=UPI00278A6EA2|nr:hypothetical protein [Rhizobium tibeticum]MDP9812309.1 hypothetical protein [Rhizobium tibeticum]